MTESSERGFAFVCEACGWHTTDRAEAVWHAMKAHSGAAGGRGEEPGRAWRAMIGGAILDEPMGEDGRRRQAT